MKRAFVGSRRGAIEARIAITLSVSANRLSAFERCDGIRNPPVRITGVLASVAEAPEKERA